MWDLQMWRRFGYRLFCKTGLSIAGPFDLPKYFQSIVCFFGLKSPATTSTALLGM
jgi:hypothetical protein